MKTTFTSATFIKSTITSTLTATAITAALLSSTATLANDACSKVKTISSAIFTASQEGVSYNDTVSLLESRGFGALAFIADDAYEYEKIPTRKGQAIGAEIFGSKYSAVCVAVGIDSI